MLLPSAKMEDFPDNVKAAIKWEHSRESRKQRETFETQIYPRFRLSQSLFMRALANEVNKDNNKDNNKEGANAAAPPNRSANGSQLSN